MTHEVVSFGETMLRLTAPPGTRLEDARTFSSYVGGTESNTLACLARFGLRCTWLSALPSNPLGRHVESELRRHGVNTSRVVWTESSDRLGTFFAEELPDPLGAKVYYDRRDSACAGIDPALVDLSVLDGARLLHLTGITLSLSTRTREVFARLLNRATERHIPISFDVNYRAKLWGSRQAADGIDEACRVASLVFCTRDDAAELWGLTGSAESIVRGIAERFERSNACRTTVLTLGREGSAQLRGDQYTAVPAFSSTGQVRFGSGDAFAAGYLYAWLEAPDLSDSPVSDHATPLLFGNAAAALKRGIAGDIATITLDDMTALIDLNGKGHFR